MICDMMTHYTVFIYYNDPCLMFQHVTLCGKANKKQTAKAANVTITICQLFSDFLTSCYICITIYFSLLCKKGFNSLTIHCT